MPDAPDPSADRRDPVALRRDLSLLYREGVAFSVMVGIGESYLAAFVLALGLGEVASGLVTTVPLLFGGAIQLVTPLGIRRVGSRRRWSVACALLQAASFVPLVAAAVVGAAPGWAVHAAATLYWSAGMAVSPAWNSWVEWLVPRPIRTRYFAWRTSGVHLGTMIGLVGGGLVLQLASAERSPLAGFAALFAIAGCCRLLSARLLASQSEGPVLPRGGTPALGALRRLPGGPGSRLVTYLLALTAGVTVSSPFFSAYMLAELDLSYARYMILVATSVAAKVAVLPVLGAAATRFGLVPMLRLAWLGIAAVPALWLASSSYPYLLVLQIVSGVAWAAHEYAAFLLLFETIRTERRVAVMTVYNLVHAVALVGGSLCGGWLLHAAGPGTAGYVAIFTVSTGLRASSILLLARVRVRDGLRPAVLPSFRAVAVRPAIGLVLRPVLSTLRRQDSSRDDPPAVVRDRPTDRAPGDPRRPT